VILTAIVTGAIVGALALSGCGGGSGSNGETPDKTDLARIGRAYLGISLGCLAPTADLDAQLEGQVDVLVEEYREAGDATFKLDPQLANPSLPKPSGEAKTVTMRKLLRDSRDQLRNCSEAGLSERAGALAERVNGVLDESGGT